MDLPIPANPQPANPSQPAGASAAPGAQPPASDPASEVFSRILAAGLAETLSPAPAPAVEPDETAAPVRKTEPEAADASDPVALLLSVIGLPIAPPAAPVVATPAKGDAAVELSLATGAKPATGTLRAPESAAGAALAPARGSQLDAQFRVADKPADAAALAAGATDLAHKPGDSQTPASAPGVQQLLLPTATHSAQQPHAQIAAGEIRTPVRAAEWNADLGKTLVWMANGERSSAEIRLNPPELGPLQIKLTLGAGDGGQANVAFASPHGAVRDAIEAAIPQLRDMLAGSGITLGQTTVSAESFRQPGDPAGSSADGDSAENIERIDGTASVPSVRTGVGLVDTFA